MLFAVQGLLVWVFKFLNICALCLYSVWSVSVLYPLLQLLRAQGTEVTLQWGPSLRKRKQTVAFCRGCLAAWLQQGSFGELTTHLCETSLTPRIFRVGNRDNRIQDLNLVGKITTLFSCTCECGISSNCECKLTRVTRVTVPVTIQTTIQLLWITSK